MRFRLAAAVSITLLLGLTGAPSSVSGQQPAPMQSVDATTRLEIIDGTIDHLRRAYIYGDVAEKMADALKTRVASKEYDAISEPRSFAETLTNHLQEVSKDKHLRVLYRAEGFPERKGPPPPEERARMRAEERRTNFGITRVERLDGNVGYMELLGFSGSPDASEPAVAAMNFVANTDALVFDLRRNGGGFPR